MPVETPETLPVVSMHGLADIPKIIEKQRQFFKEGLTREVDFRIAQLKKLKQVILKYEKEVYKALKEDLNKPAFEAFGSELGLVIGEIDHSVKKLKKWAKPKKVGTPLFFAPATSYTQAEPYGLTLLISPWNYPFQLLMMPLVGSMAAGNCSVLKPSELAPATSAICTKIIRETFEEHYVASVEGGVTVSQELLRHQFDYIFFTGSTQVGKIIYQAAAKHLTPVTLELGGKSPCIVDKDIDLKVTAKRIAWGKLLNAGQTCIAPDYLMVHSDVKAALIEEIKAYIKGFYGKNPQKSANYCRIINERHVERLDGLIHGGGTVVEGGTVDKTDRYIAPTLIDGVSKDNPIMQEEIFGPILPILEWTDIEEVIDFVNDRPKPLALYVFTKNSKLSDKVLGEVSSGGACINDTLMHIANPNMPFGGVGESGIGGYHGKSSFETFSHTKSIMNKRTFLDPWIRYAPYSNMPLLKRLMKWFG